MLVILMSIFFVSLQLEGRRAEQFQVSNIRFVQGAHSGADPIPGL